MRRDMGMAGYETDADTRHGSSFESDNFLPDRRPATIGKLAAGIILFDLFVWFMLCWLPAQLG